ncbi:MAG: GGDEF domain-containing protein [Gammaproteobacteria bacterium]|nr:GGDEF domain-containing protein [Gammaproteobacteria bacterium]MCP5196684.1 GGDEF domain-containing protein [Gammaproteobacteria bacterium]
MSQSSDTPISLSELPKTVNCLITPNPSISPQMTVEDVGSMLRHQKDLCYLPVVQEEHPIGLIRRLDFMDIFLSNYGRELHGRKPATFFMDPQPLLIEEDLLLEDASRLVTSSMNRHVDPHAFIITRRGCYQGLGWTMDLLEKITDLRVHSARYANPLTLLPGNVPIQNHIEALLRSRHPFQVAYCDLDCFKPFNDVYGYKKGDQVIQMVGRILMEQADSTQDFVGHIGGDDFIVVFKSPDWRQRCEQVLEAFAHQAPRFYNKEDRRRGGIISQDRQGHEQFFNLLSLSIGVVQPDLDTCHSHHEVATLATGAKHQAKQQSGNSLFVDRRRRVLRPPTASTPASDPDSKALLVDQN